MVVIYIPGIMKTRSKKSVLGLFDHVPWGLNTLKTGPRNQNKNDKQRERVNKCKEKRRSFYIDQATSITCFTSLISIKMMNLSSHSNYRDNN